MSRTDDYLSETDIRSPDSQIWPVRENSRIRRPWLRGAPACHSLAAYHIMHLGVGIMPTPFEIVRVKLGGSYFLACFEGQGNVLVDGRLKQCRAGQAFLLPPGTRHAFHALEGAKPWSFCWVRYQEKTGQQPIATANSPILADYNAEPLRLSILGLHHECTHGRNGQLMDAWTLLIQSYVQQFAEVGQMDSRLWKLWEQVAQRLDHPWTSSELASRVHLSEKQLERLCRRELGRTPRQQLIWLRMRRAAELLGDGSKKVATIANEVGYDNPFVFSTTFKRCMGWSPSDHHERVQRSRRTT